MGGAVAANICSRAQPDGVAIVHPTIAGRIRVPADFGGSPGDVRHRDIKYRWPVSQGQLGQH